LAAIAASIAGAAFFQDVNGDLGGERLHRCRHAVLGDHGRARGKRRPDIAVAVPSREALDCVKTRHQDHPYHCSFHGVTLPPTRLGIDAVSRA
jgi:hypothetical protein